MKLLDSLLLSGSVGVFIIGVHQTFMHGWLNSYVFFMLCAVFLLLYKVRKRPMDETQPEGNSSKNSRNLSTGKPNRPGNKSAKAVQPPKKEKR